MDFPSDPVEAIRLADGADLAPVFDVETPMTTDRAHELETLAHAAGLPLIAELCAVIRAQFAVIAGWQRENASLRRDLRLALGAEDVADAAAPRIVS